MKTLHTILALVFVLAMVASSGCSPWVVDHVWYEKSGPTYVPRALYVNTWWPSHHWYTITDGTPQQGDIKWIPWEAEAAAEHHGWFRRHDNGRR